MTNSANLTGDMSKTHRFFCKIRDIFNPNIKLLEQEDILRGILDKLIHSEDTIIYTPLNGPWYLINDEMHYSMRIGQGSVTVVNTVHTVSRDVPVGVTDLFRAIIDEVVKARVTGLDIKILQGEKKILEAILGNKEQS